MEYLDLISKIQNGDTQAQGKLYELYWEKLYRLAYVITKDKEDAMDVVQDSFIAAFSHINDLRNANAFEAWIFQIARNNAKKQLNRHKNFIDFQNDEDHGTEFLDNIPDADEAIMPENVIESQEKCELVLQTINELSEDQRACVLLFYYNGLSIKDIAQIQECSEGTVKSRLNYARKKIRDRILEIEQDNDIRLHSLMPIGILLSQITMQMPDSTQIEQMWNAIKGSAGIVGAGVVGATSTAGSGAAKGGILTTIKAKIIAGITAASVVTGGVVAATLPEPIKFTDANMEQNIRIMIDKPTGGIYADDVEELSELIVMDSGIASYQPDGTMRVIPDTVPVSSLVDLQNLPNLTSLVLRVTDLQPLLNTLGNNENLTGLSALLVDDAATSGGIEDFSFLKNLPSLKSLQANVSSSIDLTAVENCTSLNFLDIAGLGDLTLDVSNMENLIYLSFLSKTNESDLNSQNLVINKPLNHLIMIELLSDNLANRDFLQNVPSLEYLDVTETNVIRDLAPYTVLQNLQYIILGGGGYDLSPLANCPNLEVVASMHRNNINPPPNVQLIDVYDGYKPIQWIREEMFERMGYEYGYTY